MSASDTLANIAILVPGYMNPYAVERISGSFELLRRERADLSLLTPEERERVRGIAAMTTIDATLIDGLPNLSIIANYGVGYDKVDARHAARRNIMVTNTPEVLTEEVADTTLGLLLNTVRDLARAEAWLRAGHWRVGQPFPMSPLTLRGRKVGILGMGRIGLAIARRLEGFGVRIAYHNRRPIEGSAYSYFATLLGLAEAVDTLICVVPGGAATDKIIDAAVLRALGPNGVFINIGRGSTVDEAALAAALADGTIAAAGLDVFADEPNVPEPLLELPNATLLPHVGSASEHARRAMADLCVDNLLAWFERHETITPVPESTGLARRVT